jgi:chorismate synthase
MRFSVGSPLTVEVTEVADQRVSHRVFVTIQPGHQDFALPSQYSRSNRSASASSAAMAASISARLA